MWLIFWISVDSTTPSSNPKNTSSLLMRVSTVHCYSPAVNGHKPLRQQVSSWVDENKYCSLAFKGIYGRVLRHTQFNLKCWFKQYKCHEM